MAGAQNGSLFSTTQSTAATQYGSLFSAPQSTAATQNVPLFSTTHSAGGRRSVLFSTPQSAPSLSIPHSKLKSPLFAPQSKVIQMNSSADSPPFEKYTGTLGAGMVDIQVGPSNQLFHVHKKIICSKIPYFDKMFNGGFKEAAEHAASFPEDDPDAFDLLFEWVYTGRLSEISFLARNSYIVRVRLYGLAEKFLLSDLMDYTMTTIILGCRLIPLRPEAMGITYEVTGPGSHLRSYVVLSLYYAIERAKGESQGSFFKDTWPTSELAEMLSEHKEFLSDLIDFGRSSEAGKEPARVDVCEFHTHEGTVCNFKESL